MTTNKDKWTFYSVYCEKFYFSGGGGLWRKTNSVNITFFVIGSCLHLSSDENCYLNFATDENRKLCNIGFFYV